MIVVLLNRLIILNYFSKAWKHSKTMAIESRQRALAKKLPDTRQKINFIYFSNRNVPLYLNNKETPKPNSVKYLGMHLDQKIKSWIGETRYITRNNDIISSGQRLHWMIKRRLNPLLHTKYCVFAKQYWKRFRPTKYNYVKDLLHRILES